HRPRAAAVPAEPRREPSRCSRLRGWRTEPAHARARCVSERSKPATDPASTAIDRPRLKWWREAIYIGVVYFVYSTVRNKFGSAGGGPGHAAGVSYGHALDVVDIERKVHLFLEQNIQSWYLDLPAQGLIQFWNVFY